MHHSMSSTVHGSGPRVARQISSAFCLLAIVAATSIGLAPAASARGLADCFDASGSLDFDGKSYSVDIRNRCFPLGNDDPQRFGRGLYFFTMGQGGSCADKSGSLSLNGLGERFRVSTSCLRPGTYRPDVRLSSFTDGSSNFIYFSSFQIRAPETPGPPKPTPSPSPTRPTPTPTPTQTQTPISPVTPGPPPSITNPNPLTLSVRRTWRGAKVLSSDVTSDDLMQARVQTKLKPGSRVTVSVCCKLDGRGNIRELVRANGLVTFIVDVMQYETILLRDSKGRNLVRWTTG
jgi:hypothetical protein